jgi:hypothetical protein
MFVGGVKWPRGGLWLWRIVLRPVLPLSLASTFDRRRATYLPGRRIDSLGGCRYIVASPSDVRSTSDIERGSAPQFPWPVRMHTDQWRPR